MELEVETRTPKVQKVIVLGAGPGGLAAGHELSAGGVEVLVLERAPWVGGLSMTWEHRGFRFDIGGHRWFTKKDWLQNWFLKLMEGELVTVDRISRIYFDGKYFDYPVRVGNVLKTAGMLTSAHAVASSIWSQVRRAFRPEVPENIEQAYVAQFGPKLYQMFFKRYTEKVWGRDCRELSADWVSQRTKGLSIWETGKNAILKPRAKVESLVDQFVYPRLGYQRICERMREDIETCGGEVRLNSTVVGVRVAGDRTVVRYEDRESGELREVEADHVISTIPLGRLIEILTPEAPSTVLDAAKGLEFRSVITANICLDREQVTPDTWLYIHEPGIGFARIHEPKNWSPAMAPEGKTSVCAEWFCSVGDATWQMSDEEVVDRTVGHLADDLGFIDRSEVIDGFALRARQAYPVYTLDYGRRVDTLKRHLRQHEERVSICGRGGTFRYNNADHSVEMGLLVGMNLLGASYDVDSVNTEAEYHEEKVVERG
jgi:protoporphyrinogen oxidase